MKKLFSLLLILSLAAICLVGCKDETKSKETLKEETTKEESTKAPTQAPTKAPTEVPYSEGEAIAYDMQACDDIMYCFNVSMNDGEAFGEIAAGTGYFFIEYEGDNMKFTHSDKYPAVQKNLLQSLEYLDAHKEEGKIAYRISWNSQDGTIRDIEVITVSKEDMAI